MNRPTDKDNERPFLFVGLALLSIVIVVAAVFFFVRQVATNSVIDFESCRKAGGAIMESYPEQCALNGKTFTNTSQSAPVPPIDRGNQTGYVGLSEQEGLERAKVENQPARVVERDGESLPVTMDFAPGRLNFHVKDGTIVKVDIEGDL